MPAEPRELPATADVVVVGSGYAGLSAALALSRGGRDVWVVEKEVPGIGASSRNGGAIGASLRISFSAMIGRLGLDQALDFYRGARDARAHLKDLVARESIACHFAPVGRFIGAHRVKDYETLARDLELHKKHLGDANAEMVPRAEQHRCVGTDNYHGGRLVHGDGNLHPALLHLGLLQRVEQAGATVVGLKAVTGIARDDGQFVVEVGEHRIRARDVVVASNGYTGAESAWLQRRLLPIQSQIIATEPLPKDLVARLIPDARQLGDTCELHHYYRTSPDGERILFGGRAGQREVGNPRRSGAHLYRRLITLFPDLKGTGITHSWGGMIAYTFDHLPHMYQHEGIHYVAGFCGSGVAMANYLGHKTALKVLGRRDEAANPFDREHPTVPFYAGRPWFLGPIVWFKGLRDALKI